MSTPYRFIGNPEEFADDVIIVSRHDEMVEWIERQGFAGPVYSRVMPEDVEGKHVIGVLPLHLASYAKSFTRIKLRDHRWYGEIEPTIASYKIRRIE